MDWCIGEQGVRQYVYPLQLMETYQVCPSYLQSRLIISHADVRARKVQKSV